MHIPASHRLLSVDLNPVRKSTACQAIVHRRAISQGCAAQAPGNSEEPTPSQVGWNTPVAQVPDLLTEGNSGEAETLQHSFLPPPALFSVLSGSDSVTGFHPVIISTGPSRTSQAS